MHPLEFEKAIREADLQALHDYKRAKGPPPTLYKAGFLAEKQEVDKPFVFVASEESQDRLGDTITAAGWDLVGFKKNPVFLWVHDYWTAPLGTVPKVWIEGRQLLNLVEWDEADEFARQIKGKYERRILRAESVGFRAMEFEENSQGGITFTKQELLEISAVPIPAHPGALAKAMAQRHFTITMPQVNWTIPLDTTTAGSNTTIYTIPSKTGDLRIPNVIVQKRVISYDAAHSGGTPKADQDAEWDAGAEVAAASVDDLKVMCAWVDPDQAEDKGGYKLPHHKASGEHPVVFRACAAVMAVMHGGRGGANIPDADWPGIYSHISKHYEQFDMEAPPMEGEAAITEPVEKAGAVLNRTNRDKLGRAIALLQEVLTSAEKPADETPKGVDTEIIREACKALREELEIK